MGSSAVAIVVAADAVLLAQASHQLRKALPVRLRKKCAAGIALAVALGQLGKVRFQKRQKHCRRAGLQEKSIGENVLASGRSGSADEGLQIAWRIGDVGQHRRADHTGVNASGDQMPQRFEAQIGAGGARLKNPRQISVQRGHGDVDKQPVALGDFRQQRGVADDQVGLGDDADFQAAVSRQFFEDAAGDMKAAPGRLVGIGSGADGDLFAWLYAAKFLS